MFTDIEEIQREALFGTYWLLFDLVPDMNKGMLKGVIYALGIQQKAVYIHIFTHWMVYPSCLYFFALHHNLGISGLWLAKICLECVIVTLYLAAISFSDWDLIAAKV